MATQNSNNKTARTIYFGGISQTNSFVTVPKYLPFELINDNTITSARYTILSFVPLQIIHQFSKLANIYFLFIGILQQVPGWSPTGRWTTIAPLTVFVTLAMIREAVDDWRRHRQDDTDNQTMVSIVPNLSYSENGSSKTNKFLEKWFKRWSLYRTASDAAVSDHEKLFRPHEQEHRKETPLELVFKKRSELNVGDIVFLRDGESVPADLILLASSGDKGVCYVETSSLDGESNLKSKQALPVTSNLIADHRSAALFQGCIRSEGPNNDLYSFEGCLECRETPSVDISKHPLAIDQLLLRSSILRNTGSVYGVVVYTGEDCKIRRNASTRARTKLSTVDSNTNKLIACVFSFIILLATISTALGLKWHNSSKDDYDYLFLFEYDISDIIAQFFTFVILYNTMIPISLYVTMEMVKIAQAYLIQCDLEMYDPETDTPAEARTSSVNEDLGRVQYVFTDKTGTLTENKMKFRAFSAGGTSYQHDEEILDSILLQDLYGPLPKKMVHQFLEAVTLCHTVIPTGSGSDIVYQSSSPDEGALLKAAKELGYVLTSKTSDSLTFEVQNLLSNSVLIKTFKLLCVIEFTSARRRMSAIYETPDNRIFIYSKGADTVMFQLLGPDQPESLEKSQRHIQQFAVNGLRTLVYAFRELSRKEYEDWYEKFHHARTMVTQRHQHIEAAAQIIECDLKFLGISGIEDALQPGVPASIQSLKDAGIKVWMLTGDKLETAVNIAAACQLVPSGSQLLTVTGEEESVETVTRQLEAARDAMESDKTRSYVLVLDGAALTVVGSTSSRSRYSQALLPNSKSCYHTCIPSSIPQETRESRLAALLAQVGLMAPAVICARVSPIQKAGIVKMVKHHVGNQTVTLSIGDGANDIAMIKEAHVGIGITGQEGLQAARASDYSIARFRFLTRLLFVQGRRSYIRTCLFTRGSLYKCLMLFFTQFVYQFFTGFSGTSLYEPWTLSLWNIIFSSIVVILLGVFEQDIPEKQLMQFPFFYQHGVQNRSYNVYTLSRFLFTSFFQAIILSLVLPHLLGFPTLTSSISSIDSSWSYQGSTAFGVAVITVNVTLALVMSKYWVYITLAFASLTVVIWGFFLYIYTMFIASPLVGWEVSGVSEFIQDKVFALWILTLLIVVVIMVLPDIAMDGILANRKVKKKGDVEHAI